MNTKAVRADILLFLTAAIWGFAFAAQKSGMEFLGPFTFNGIRFLLGSASLLPLIIAGKKKKNETGLSFLCFLKYSLIAGACLFIAASLQQIGIIYTTPGHSGFITGLYVVLTPIAGIFLGRKTGLPTWIGAILTLTGLFFLSVAGSIFGARSEGETIQINPGDIITAVSALFWTFHVLAIDTLVQKIDPLPLSSGQFFWCGFFSLIAAIARQEAFSLSALSGALVPILYGGICSVGIAYTLQTVAQKDAPPAHATIILCLEGVFAALGGFLILHDSLSRWTLAGFILMFCGMLATQWEVIIKGRNFNRNGEER
ncbi:MAG: DMT family transporter [Treponema sp.]|nr:DMT family transporter [Treponema sp.]